MNDENKRPLPEKFLLVKYGQNVYTKDGTEQSFDFSPDAADKVIAEFANRGRDLVIDYEHSTLSGEEAPAAGWIDRLEKGKDGLFAHVKYWTDRGKEYLEKGEYRYFSPTLMMEDGRVKALHSVALTNHPAMHGVAALVASDLNPPKGEKRKDHIMTKTEKALQRLLGETTLALNDGADDAIASKLEALADELPVLREAKKKCEELVALADKAKKEAAFERGAKRGAFCNAQKETLLKLALADLEELEKATPDNAAVPTQPLPQPGKPEPQKAVLSDDEKKIARQMGLSDEEFAEVKKAIQEKEEKRDE